MKTVFGFIFLSLFFAPSYAQIKHLTDSNTGAQSWELKQDGVVFYMNQLLPDQLKAFYSNRGFSQSQIKDYVNSCVFMTVIRNESASGVMDYDLNDWSVMNLAKEARINSADIWLDSFKALNVKKSALIAFRWAQFPMSQQYEPGGDWNQGMLSLGSQTNEFDVIARWKVKDQSFQMSLRGISCAQ